jgi:hypothetical protein
MIMSIRESQRLAELEKTIARGKKTFVEVGLALAEIRDLRLYKTEHASFREYCQQKWGWTKQRAYQLMDAAEVQRSTAVDLSTERAARELGKIPPPERAAVVQRITESGESVTVASIKQHLPPPPMVRRGTEDGSQTTEDGRGDATPNPTLPPPPSQVVDGTDWPIPTQLIPLWKRADEVQKLLTTLSRVKGVLRAAQENRDKLFAEVNFSSALSQLDQAWTDIKTAKPFAVCPTCQGQLPDQCTLCRGRGLISEHRWNTCVTREDKEFRERANAAKLKPES